MKLTCYQSARRLKSHVCVSGLRFIIAYRCVNGTLYVLSIKMISFLLTLYNPPWSYKTKQKRNGTLEFQSKREGPG